MRVPKTRVLPITPPGIANCHFAGTVNTKPQTEKLKSKVLANPAKRRVDLALPEA
jgi:hypothetical protein